MKLFNNIIGGIETNNIDEVIRNKEQEIEKLREEVENLQLQKSKGNEDFVGRFFLMQDCQYIYVTGIDRRSDDRIYGLGITDFEYSATEISKCTIFDKDEILKEVTKEDFKKVIKNKCAWDELKKVMEG